MKTNSTKLYGVPAEAKNAEYYIRVVTRKANGTLVCDGYKPSVKPKNPVDRFELVNENGVLIMSEFFVCSGMQAAFTPLNALKIMDEEKKNALLAELAEDGEVKF